MDEKDFRLLVALHENARQSYRELGRRAKLSHPAVRERLRSLEKRGILQGYWMTVDPGIFDRDDLIAWFEGDWTREDALRAVKAQDVAWVAWKVDGEITVQLWPADRALAVERLSEVMSATPTGQFLAQHRRSLPWLNLLDWQILEAMVDDPRESLDKIITSTHLSPKTVRKRLQILLRSRAIVIAPRLGALADAGELVYTLSVFGDTTVTKLREILEDAFLVNQFHSPPAKYLLCRATSLSEVTAKVHKVERLEGVKSASVTLNRERFMNTEFVLSLIKSKIQELEALRRAGEPPARRVRDASETPLSVNQLVSDRNHSVPLSNHRSSVQTRGSRRIEFRG